MKHRICQTAELPAGERKIVELEGRSIGVFNVNGNYHAIRNMCPHQKAPLCKGHIGGTTLPGGNAGEYTWGCEGEIVRCPWHGWEFSVVTGQSVFNPHKVRVKSYKVSVEPDETPDPSVETFEVSVESEQVYVHL